MKNKIRQMILAFILCISAFFMPVTAYAAGEADTTPPVIHAEVLGKVLHIEADDEDSGVDAVYINGKRINYRVDHAVDLELEDFAGTDTEMITIYAVDFAGNQSKTVEIKNPFCETISKPFTPDGQATVVDNATDEDGKEFYTFTTPEEHIFYLVIDKQRESENVYFLNAVTERDLMALAEKENEQSIASESAVPKMLVCNCTKKCVAGEVNTVCPVCKNDLKSCIGKAEKLPVTEEPEKKAEQPEKGSNGTMIFVLLAVVAVGGAGYYFKIYKPKHELDDAEDLDDLFDDSDETEINEDEQQPELPERKEPFQPKSENGAGTDTVEYDDYPDDEPEQEE